MDEIVEQAMAKWPNVPAVYGWLSLDRRGGWRIKGDAVTNPVIAAFIARNYSHDAEGRWFFQNGPQRVYTALDYTPYVYRILWSAAAAAALRIEAHTGAAVSRIDAAWIDEQGVLLLATDLGIGMLDDRNLEQLLPYFCDASGHALDEDAVAERLELLQGGRDAALQLMYAGGQAAIKPIASAAVAAKFGFVPLPAAPPGTEICP